MDVGSAGRFLVIVGLAVLAVGGLLVLGSALGLGRLPGDIAIRRGNVRIFAPIATCLLLSLVATVLLNLFVRR